MVGGDFARRQISPKEFGQIIPKVSDRVKAYFPLFTTWINGLHTSAPCSLRPSGSALTEHQVSFFF